MWRSLKNYKSASGTTETLFSTCLINLNSKTKRNGCAPPSPPTATPESYRGWRSVKLAILHAANMEKLCLDLSVLSAFLVPRIRQVQWNDYEDDPMSKREGKYFNMGSKAAADELEKALKELDHIAKVKSELK